MECKNIGPNNPLLLSAVPRIPGEAFHDLLVHVPDALYRQFQVESIRESLSAYKPGDMVGKKTDQVHRDGSGALAGNDEAKFDKLNQAVNSCQDLIPEFSRMVSRPFRGVVVPVLVVPTGILWQVDYDPNGSITAQPRQVKRAALFLEHAWPVSSVHGDSISYRMSHIEILTFEALAGIAESWSSPGRFFPL